MSQWGCTVAEAHELPDYQIERLLLAYLERTKFEAKVLISTLGEAMNSKPKDEGQMSLGALAAMGFGIQGA